ncbi:MAG: glutathione S-transferase family protein [Granulosicoccaceae bacterium]
MKLYTYPSAPSPQRVHLLMAEKGIDIPSVLVDLRANEQLGASYRTINPRCTVPALVLEDGTVISEVIAVCHYLEALYPARPLFGTEPKERALISEWDHRAESECLIAIAEVLRNRSKAYKGRALPGALNLEQIPALAERGETRIRAFFDVLEQQLAAQPFVAGKQFSMADITTYVAVGFARWVKIEPSDSHPNLTHWRQQLAARPAFQTDGEPR